MTKKDKRSPENRTQIIVALIGVAGGIVAAALGNVDPLQISGARSGSRDGQAQTRLTASSKSSENPSTAGQLTATADDITYRVISVERLDFSDSECLLVFRMHVATHHSGINFWEDLFRLDAGGIVYAPHEGGSNEWLHEFQGGKNMCGLSYPRMLSLHA